MNSEAHAILRLLRDDDPETVGLVKEQLAGRGPEFLPDLREMLRTDDARVSQHVADIAGRIDAREAEAAFTRLCAAFPEDGDLEAAAFLLARVLRPGLADRAARTALDDWGVRLAEIIANASEALERVMYLGDLMECLLKFSGNTGSYYDPDNSLLPRVIETRQGIPITLTLVCILVGRRAGMAVEGVNFPGHFLARHGGVLFDPFNRCRILTESDCRTMLEPQSLTPQPSYFATARPRAMLIRLLANLLYIYQSAADPAESERMSRWIRLLSDR